MSKPIGVISDTHDRIDNALAALDFFSANRVDHVVHCGDWKQLDTMRAFIEHAKYLKLPVKAVLGNNDLAQTDFLNYAASVNDFQLDELLTTYSFANMNIAVHHGHHQPTKRRLLADSTINILFFGHTHKPLVYTEHGKLIVNPGSTAFAIPRRKVWMPTVAIVDAARLSAKICELKV